jgi:hypothetical protein
MEIMMKKLTQVLIMTMLLLAVSIPTGIAQSENLQLSVSRTRGYSGFNNDIQGHFTLTARGPEDLQRVQFLMDGEVVLEVNTSPFKFNLNTDDYENGVHTVSALGILSDGTRISSTDFTREFVPPKNLPSLLGLGVGIIILFIIIAIFDAVLKVIGMWKAARRTQIAWFVCLLIFNTAGILPIIYFLTGGKKPETLERK